MVSNPDIAEAVLVSSTQVVVNGKSFGQVNFIAWEKGTDRFIVFDVYVRTNLSLIDSQIRALFPKDDIRLSQANGSVVISGSVSDPKIASQTEAVVQAAGFKTVNLLESPVRSLSQVQLQVRVAEVNRTRMRDLGSAYAYQASPGVGGFATGGGPGNVDSVAGGILGGTFSGLNLLVLGGNANHYDSRSANARRPARTRRAELDCNGWPASEFSCRWRIPCAYCAGRRINQHHSEHCL